MICHIHGCALHRVTISDMSQVNILRPCRTKALSRTRLIDYASGVLRWRGVSNQQQPTAPQKFSIGWIEEILHRPQHPRHCTTEIQQQTILRHPTVASSATKKAS
jgi:hypothetical protein